MGKRELIYLLPFASDYVVSVQGGFLLLVVLGVGCILNLKFRLKVSSNVIYRRRFKESNIRTVPCAYATPTSNGLLENLICAYATPTSNGLLENLIQFTIKTRNGKVSFKRHIGAPKFGISGYCFLILLTFSVIANLLAYVRVKIFILRRIPVCFKCP